MSGTYQNWNEDAPGGGAETRAAVASGLAEAYAGIAMTQVESREMFVQHGAAAVSHQVGEPGRMGDPDATLPDASDY